MKKRYFLPCIAALVLGLSACAGAGEPQAYEKEHEHSYGAWYDAAPAEGEAQNASRVRYCKICHEPQYDGGAAD